MLTVVPSPAFPTFLMGGGALGELIRSHDWATTPLGPPEAWPQSLRSALSICLHSAFPTAIYWGPELRLLYNDAWAPIPADRHPWALGRPAAEVWSDIWHVVGPQFAHVMDTGNGVSTFDQMLPMVREGVTHETYWNYSMTAIRGEDGVVVGVFNQGNETTAAVLARRQAQMEIERLGRLFVQAPSAVAILRGPCHVFEIVNPAYEALVDRTGLIGAAVAEVLPEVVSQGFVALLDEVYRTGEPHIGRAVPVRLNREPGQSEERLVDFIYEPLTNSAGERYGIFVQATDVTKAARAEAALRESEEFCRSVVESSGDCIKVLELDGTLQFMNQNGRCLLEIDDFGTVCGAPWTSLWPETTRGEVQNAIDGALAGGVGRFSAFCPTAKGTPKWWDVVVTAVLNRDGAPVRLVSISRDVTDQRRSEEARQLLVRELDHRVKNLFAIASGMVAMTARTAPSVEAMSAALKGRLHALAKAHELIRSAISDPGLPAGQHVAQLRPLVEEVLKPHLTAGVASQLALDGPHIPIGPNAATSLALILHELATNAAKYGALSVADGHLSISWALEGENLNLRWSERVPSGGIAPPLAQGFGSKLAFASATGQLGGTISYDWHTDGVQIELTADGTLLRR